MNRLERAFVLFDTYNQQDPHTLVYDGVTYPAEYFYALQMHDWVKKLDPNASETLLLASRAQHIGRWKSPRDNYPVGKTGYYKWRTDLYAFHAVTAGSLMAAAGYNEDEIKAVQHIIRKENLRTDHEVQVMEGALCLVFLVYQYEDFIKKHDEEKVTRILKRSWAKMNQAGREAALGLPYSPLGKELLNKALE